MDATLTSVSYPAYRSPFRCEELFYLLIGDGRSKQADELFPRVAPIRVQGELTAVFAALAILWYYNLGPYNCVSIMTRYREYEGVSHSSQSRMPSRTWGRDGWLASVIRTVCDQY